MGLETGLAASTPVNNVKVIQPMTKDEAKHMLTTIRLVANAAGQHMIQLRKRVVEFDERMGWEVLGYPSLAACFQKELGQTFQTGYRQLKAAIVERNILALLPEGEIPARVIPERHVRDTNIGKLPPDSQAEAYRNATQMAKAEGLDEPTTDHVNRAVTLEETKETVFQSEYSIVSHMVASGHVTAQVGRDMEQALNRLKPKQRGYIVQLIGKFGLSCPALFMAIAGMFDRKPGHESKVLPEVLSGFLAGTPLKIATISDLNRANAEAQRQHITEAEAARLAAGGPDPVPVIITLYKGDVARSLKVMQKEFGFVWMLRLFWKMYSEA